MAITEVRIHPAIGIARVGDSDTDFFIGPERPWDRSEPAGGYKDAQCRIKRQAARFRVFGYDGGVPVELTAATADIQWSVHLVNRKATADGFEGGGRRNASVTGAARDKLVIDPGQRTVAGADQRQVFDTGKFTVPGHAAVPVPLGEVRTDDDGRLLVLGGFGSSSSPSSAGFGSFADNDGWHDDVADGPVTATVTVGGQTFTAMAAWVIVAPPKFAPGLDSVIRLWDAVYDAHVLAGHLSAPATPSYTNDVYPILQAAVTTHAVNSDAIGHHNFVHPLPGSAAIVARFTASGAQHMPKLYSPSSILDLTITSTQQAIMAKWAANAVANDWSGGWGQGPPPVNPDVTPGGMDKAALENCVGGAFFPGIEGGQILTNASLYLPILTNAGVPSFRLDPAKVAPGDITARMAVPWQADFNACDQYWWPVPRPNEVTVAGTGVVDWERGVTGGIDFVSKWNKMGFVTLQGGNLVETDRCDTADTWVSLVTPALSFVNVAQGPMGVTRKVPEALVFEIHSTSPVTLKVTAQPVDPSLSVDTPVPVVVPVAAGVTVQRIWIVYAAPNTSHIVSDSITLSCPETGQTWTVPITGNSVPRKTAAVALVLDKSGSMSDDRGDGMGTKAQSLRDAAATFVSVMLDGDAISLTAFDDNASVIKGMTVLDAPGSVVGPRHDVLTVINGPGLNPGGDTSIGDGIASGIATLSGSTADLKSLVVLTDGMENEPQWIADVAADISETTYAVGLGTTATTSAAALETISGNHGGYLLITGAALGGDNQFLLAKYFLQILSGVSNAEIVLDPTGVISAGQVQRVPFTLCEEDNLADIILLAQDLDALEFALETPSGHVIRAADVAGIGGRFVDTDLVSYFRVPLPLLVTPGRPAQVGTWHALIGHGGHNRRTATAAGADFRQLPAQRYSVIVHAWSDVSFTAGVHQSSYEPGATATVHASVAAAGIPVSAGVSCWAEVTRPGGTTFTLPLTAADDQFSATFTATVPGDYAMRVRAAGRTRRGNPFHRERALSVGVSRGGDTPPPGGRGDFAGALREHDRRWCEMLRCMLATLGGNERLKAAGIDPREFVKCVELLCARSVGDRHDRARAAVSIANLLAEEPK